MSQKAERLANLRLGYPASECIRGSSEMLQKASQNVLTKPELEESLFQYGAWEGPDEFREELATFLTQEYGDKVTRDRLLVTSGASQGLHLVATTLFTKDNPLFVEELSYYYAMTLFKQLDAKIIPVPMDKEGLIPEEFETLVVKEHAKASHLVTSETRPYWSMAYLIPTFHNPTGICYSAERCKTLISLARKHNLLLVCDDVYNLLYYTGGETAPTRLLQYDNRTDADYCGSVVSNCSFTKILAPGLRLGWIETSERLVRLLARSFVLQSGGCANHYTAGLITEVLKLGLETENVRRLRSMYKRRMELLLTALRDFLPGNCQISCEAKGGYFVWMTLPSELDAGQLRTEVLRDSNVDFLVGNRCSPEQKHHNCLRLSISACVEEEIRPGVQRLCATIKNKSK